MPYHPIVPSVRSFWSSAYHATQCKALWHQHLEWLADCGFARANERGHAEPTPPSGHEVVDLLAQFVHETGLVNAHLGLTSSDIVDNVRLLQLAQCRDLLLESINQTRVDLGAVFALELECVGLTHWQPASLLSWKHRCFAWLSPLVDLENRAPRFPAKRFGGSVGDGAALSLVVSKEQQANTPFDWQRFGLDAPNNLYPLQSSDHSVELAFVAWCCAVAAQLHKIACDQRLLISRGVVRLYRPLHHAGSSAMPHKLNPYRLEKVCSICRSLATVQQEVWDVAAHNSLERTLDTSWQLNHALRRLTEGLALALDTFALVDCEVDEKANAADVARHRDQISSEMDLTRQVLAGASRWSAYQMALQSNHKIDNAKTT